MKTQDRRRYCLEQFKKMLPLLNGLINRVRLTDKAEKYNVNGAEFLIRLNKDIIEMSLAAEKPIFPTLAFRPINDVKADLLYYRIGDDFKSKLNEAIA
jgi:hypothetical protein